MPIPAVEETAVSSSSSGNSFRDSLKYIGKCTFKPCVFIKEFLLNTRTLPMPTTQPAELLLSFQPPLGLEQLGICWSSSPERGFPTAPSSTLH